MQCKGITIALKVEGEKAREGQIAYSNLSLALLLIYAF